MQGRAGGGHAEEEEEGNDGWRSGGWKLEAAEEEVAD